MPQIIGEYVDRLCTIEMELNLKGRPRDKTKKLYDSARKKQKYPLTYLAAKGLIDSVQKDDHVIFLTGAGMPPFLPKGETDGPLGVASLARAIYLGLGGKPVLMTEERCLGPTLASCKAANLSLSDEIENRMHQGYFLSLPEGEDGALENCIEILDKFMPKAIIAIEKTGPNLKGVFHTVRGYEVKSETQLHVYHLIEEAKKRGVLTIGIGDGGNEIGCGLIFEDVKKMLRWGEICQCPCQGGVATYVATDVLLAVAISNWGAYGIAACMAFMLENIDLIQDVEMEENMLRACVKEGCFDGVLESQAESVDATPMVVQTALVTMLRAIVKNGLTKIK